LEITANGPIIHKIAKVLWPIRGAVYRTMQALLSTVSVAASSAPPAWHVSLRKHLWPNDQPVLIAVAALIHLAKGSVKR
jgi:hypothetical protein